MQRRWLMGVVAGGIGLALLAYWTVLLGALRPSPSTETEHYARAISYDLGELSQEQVRTLITERNVYFVYRLPLEGLGGLGAASSPALAERVLEIRRSAGVVVLVVPRDGREIRYLLPEPTWNRALVRCLDFSYTFLPPSPQVSGAGPWFTCLSGDNGESWQEAHTFDSLGFSQRAWIEPMPLARYELRNDKVYVWPE